MNFKKLFLLGAVAMALTASFAFKPAAMYVVASTPSLVNSSCVRLLVTDDDCSPYNEGAQCTVYYNASHPAQPAFETLPAGSNPDGCVTPLYHFW